MTKIRAKPRTTLTIVGALAVAALTFGILVWLILRDSDTILPLLHTVQPIWLAPIVLAYVIDMFLFSYVWHSLLTSVASPRPYAESIALYSIANMAKRLPGTIWYVGGRAALYAKAGVSTRSVLLASAYEYALHTLSCMTLLGPFVLLSLPEQSGRILPWLVLLVALSLNPWTVRKVITFAQEKTAEGEARQVSLRQFYQLLALCAAGWLIGAVILYATLSAIGHHYTLNPLPVTTAWLAAGAAGYLATFLPSNFGVSELTTTAVLSVVVASSVAALSAIVVRILTTAMDLMAGFLFLAFSQRHVR